MRDSTPVREVDARRPYARLVRWVEPGWWRLSPVGLFFAATYFLISWSPSLLPRTWYYQGYISGLVAAAGYALGVLLGWLARHAAAALGLQVSVRPGAGRWLRLAAYAAATLAVVRITVANVRSQGRTAAYVHLSPPTPLDWASSIVLAILIALAFLVVARLLRRLTRRVAAAAGRVLPRAVATGVAVVLVATVTAWVSDNVVLERVMERFAATAARTNAQPPPGRAPPVSPLRSGSPASLEPWAGLGYQGQLFVTSAPSAAAISATTGRPAVEPIRVYAGLTDGRSVEDVADAVVRELVRTGAFDRTVLAVLTSTGTGWVDDWSVQSIEYLSDGDSAVASMQYSFVPSAMAVMTDRSTVRQAGKALFDRVYAAWLQVPQARRPKLVVGGESLGSYGGQAAFRDVSDMMARAQGGVWSGTPSFTDIAARLTAARDPGSLAIAPVLDNGRNFRFATSPADLAADYYGRPLGSWLFPRFVYAQHPSDPVVWWDPAILGAEPDWLREPRGRDVNPDVTWIPFVTFWQLTTDMAVGHDTPDGYGHRYGPELVPAWAAVLGRSPGGDYSRMLAGMRQTVYRSP